MVIRKPFPCLHAVCSSDKTMSILSVSKDKRDEFLLINGDVLPDGATGVVTVVGLMIFLIVVVADFVRVVVAGLEVVVAVGEKAV